MMNSYNRTLKGNARYKEKALQDEMLKKGSKIIGSFFLVLVFCAFCNNLLQ